MRVRIKQSPKAYTSGDRWLVEVKPRWYLRWVYAHEFCCDDAYERAKTYAQMLASPKIEYIK